MLYKTFRELKAGLGIHFSEGEGEGTGGGGSGAGGKKETGGAPDAAAELAALKAENAALKAAAAGPKDGGKGGAGDGGEGDDLAARARANREKDTKAGDREKGLEAAIRFGLKSAEFLKQNETLLPKDVSDIFKQADKETFGDAIEKDAAIKAGLVQSFFSVQANVDLLTGGQKATLDDYLKLTKTGKQDQAQKIYDMIFEPAFEMLKRVKRAEALTKGYSSGSSDEDAYKQKMIGISRKHYLGEKSK